MTIIMDSAQYKNINCLDDNGLCTQTDNEVCCMCFYHI